jgi:hypothetical protein
MAIGAGTYTLADYALNSNQPLIRAITFSLLQYGNIMEDCPLVDNQSLIANGVRFEGNLPSVNWSQLNAEGVTTRGQPTNYQEQAYIIRNYIDVDKFLVLDKNQIQEPRAIQAQAYLRALTYDFNFKFIKNDHVTGDANAPVGLRYRIDNGSVFGVRPENKIDASALDMKSTTLTTAATIYNGNKFLELVDQLLWSVDAPDGQGVTLYMNEVMKRRFNVAMRALGTSGGMDVTQDQFQRTITKYKNATIRDPGYKADQATRIITTTELNTGAADTGGNSTSIYAVNYGMDHFFGWQFGPPNVQDMGLIYNGTIYRTLLDWAVGLINTSTRSIGRLYDILIQ